MSWEVLVGGVGVKDAPAGLYILLKNTKWPTDYEIRYITLCYVVSTMDSWLLKKRLFIMNKVIVICNIINVLADFSLYNT